MSRARRFLLVVCASISIPVLAEGQRAVGVYCPAHQWSGSCDGMLDCDRVWANHVRSAHRGSDADSYWDRVTPASFSLRGTPGFVTVRAGLLGGTVGAMALSFVEGPDSNTYRAQAGLLLGAGTFLAGGAIANRGGWSLPASTVLGAGAGAALGAGAGQMMEKSPSGTEERKLERERTQAATVQGAAIGAALGLAMPLVSKAVAWRPPRQVPWRHAELIYTGSRLGLRWRW